MSGDSSAKNVPNELQAYYLTVGWALDAIGPTAARILCARLTRRPKSTESSWATIAQEQKLAVLDVKAIYRKAVPAFVAQVRGRELRYDLRTAAPSEEVIVATALERCAAAERGDHCAVA